ncbi:MAG: hypothetical protein U9N73_05615, partial [Candidatus Auribacterota bacterium]|nr:hypothetical protein [Candidatus Auribacterota bacterium]
LERRVVGMAEEKDGYRRIPGEDLPGCLRINLGILGIKPFASLESKSADGPRSVPKQPGESRVLSRFRGMLVLSGPLVGREVIIL